MSRVLDSVSCWGLAGVLGEQQGATGEPRGDTREEVLMGE